MPNLNVSEPGMSRPVRPMMPGGGGGGALKIVVIVLVVAVVAVGGYFLYDSGVLPFGKKKAPPLPAEVVLPPPEPTPQPVTPAPEPEVKTPEPTPALGTGKYTVVIYSYLSKRLADEEAARWTNAGFPAVVTEKNVGGTVVYRVNIGRYETRQLASKAGKDIEHMLETGYWVDRLQ